MAPSAIYGTEVSAGGYPYAHDFRSDSPPPTPTLVNAPQFIERPSVDLKISSSGANIVNANVVDASGRALYSISSDSKRMKIRSHRDNTEVATVEWDRSSPRMVFRGKKVKCKDWLPLAGPDTEYVPLPFSCGLSSEVWIRSRILFHGDAQFVWTQRSSRGFVSHEFRQLVLFAGLFDSSQLIPANRPGLAIAKWRRRSRTDELHVKIYQEALVEPGFLEAIVLSIILLQSGQSFGDSLGTAIFFKPKYFSTGAMVHRFQ